MLMKFENGVKWFLQVLREYIVFPSSAAYPGKQWAISYNEAIL